MQFSVSRSFISIWIDDVCSQILGKLANHDYHHNASTSLKSFEQWNITEIDIM